MCSLFCFNMVLFQVGHASGLDILWWSLHLPLDLGLKLPFKEMFHYDKDVVILTLAYRWAIDGTIEMNSQGCEGIDRVLSKPRFWLEGLDYTRTLRNIVFNIILHGWLVEIFITGELLMEPSKWIPKVVKALIEFYISRDFD